MDNLYNPYLAHAVPILSLPGFALILELWYFYADVLH